LTYKPSQTIEETPFCRGLRMLKSVQILVGLLALLGLAEHSFADSSTVTEPEEEMSREELLLLSEQTSDQDTSEFAEYKKYIVDGHLFLYPIKGNKKFFLRLKPEMSFSLLESVQDSVLNSVQNYEAYRVGIGYEFSPRFTLEFYADPTDTSFSENEGESGMSKLSFMFVF